MKLALGQPVVHESVEQNIGAAVDLVGAARRQGADVMLLPELCLSGYRLDAIAADPDRWAVSVADARLEPLRRACRRAGIAVAVGAAVTDVDGEPPHNATLWVRDDGTIEHVYSKVHLWDSERKVFAAGDRWSTVDYRGLRIGIGICYDAGFPEFVRAYARLGVDAVFFSSAFATGSEEHRYDVYHRARALENGIFVAVANCVGTVDGTRFFGRSEVFDPNGRMTAEVSAAESLAVTELAAGPHDVVPYLLDLRTNTTEPQRFQG